MSQITRSGSSVWSTVIGDAPAAAPRASLGRRDRPHRAGSSPRRKVRGRWRTAYKRGLEQSAPAAIFEAHEELETAWRAAPPRSAISSRGSSTSRSRGTRRAAGGRWRPHGSWRRRRGGSGRSRPPTGASTSPGCSRRWSGRESARRWRLARPRRRRGVYEGFVRPMSMSARLTATCSHQSRWKKSSRPSATSVTPLATWTIV